MSHIGRVQTLVILRESDNGFYLDGGKDQEILLPKREIPPDVEQGDEVSVFISRDSEDRIVATTRIPLCQVNEFAAMEVLEVHPRLGAFLDWKFPKDLLLPYAEQSRPVRKGERVVVRVILDPKSERLIATTKLGRYLDKTAARYLAGDPVSLIVLEETPLGFVAIIEGRHRGLIHRSDLVRRLEIGERLEGFVRAVKEDHKIDLTLEPPGRQRVGDLSSRILDELRAAGGELAFGDSSPPDVIREHFGSSKKAFKQAVGALYKKGLIDLNPESIRLRSASPKSPPS